MMSYITILIGRFIYGVGSGAFTILVNKYLNDVAPLEWKGRVGMAFPFFNTLGLVLANIVGLPSLTSYYKEGSPIEFFEANKDKTFCRALKLQFSNTKFGEEESASEQFFRYEYW